MFRSFELKRVDIPCSCFDVMFCIGFSFTGGVLVEFEDS
jgi:hypothetical protein